MGLSDGVPDGVLLGGKLSVRSGVPHGPLRGRMMGSDDDCGSQDLHDLGCLCGDSVSLEGFLERTKGRQDLGWGESWMGAEWPLVGQGRLEQ